MDASALTLPLFSDRLVVRDLVLDDVQAMHAYASDPEVARYLFWGPNSFEETEASLASFVAAQEEMPRMIYELGIALPQDDRLIGALCLYLGDCQKRNDAEVGFVLHPDFWGRGYVTEAVRVLMGAAFETLGLRRIWATCDARNIASVRVLEKLGMRREGTFKGSRKTESGWIDEHTYGVLGSEFIRSTVSRI